MVLLEQPLLMFLQPVLTCSWLALLLCRTDSRQSAVRGSKSSAQLIACNLPAGRSQPH